MLSEDRAAEGIDLAMEANREPRPFKAEIKSSDPGEERCHREGQLESPWPTTSLYGNIYR